MTADPQILNLPTAATTQPVATSEHRHRSKIFRLPKKVRDQLNQMLLDGVPYLDIKTNLGEYGKDITVDNISDWKNDGGYPEWVEEQRWREIIRARLEAFSEPITDSDPAQLSLTGLQMALTQLCEQLRDLGPGARKEQFENNADKYLRLLNSLARLSKTTIALQQYRGADAAAPNGPRALKQQDPSRDFSQTERDALLDRADDLFNFKSAARLRREMDQGKIPIPFAAPQRSEGGSSSSSFSSSPMDSSSPGTGNGTASSSSPTDSSSSQPEPQDDTAQPDENADANGSAAIDTAPIENQKSEIQNSAPLPATTPPPSPQDDTAQPDKNGDANTSAAIDATAIQNQNSKIENSSPPDVQPPSPAEPSPQLIQNENSQMKTPATENQNPKMKIWPLKNQKSQIKNTEKPQPSTCNLQPSTSSSPPERCHDCGAPLPPLLPNGQRPHSACHACNTPLYPPGTLFDHCQFCGAAQPLHPNNVRVSEDCRRCRSPLPPPGQRFVTECPACGFSTPIDNMGQRFSSHCPDCHAALTLLQPADPPSPVPWKPEDAKT